MRDFKDTTRTAYTKGGPSGGLKGAAVSSHIRAWRKPDYGHPEPAPTNRKG